jgi:hypothetical protein
MNALFQRTILLIIGLILKKHTSIIDKLSVLSQRVGLKYSKKRRNRANYYTALCALIPNSSAGL